MDNKIFNVNGGSKEYLAATLRLMFTNPEYSGARVRPMLATGWTVSSTHGFILHWVPNTSIKDFNKFPVPLGADELVEVVWKWLKESPDAKNVVFDGWDRNSDHDGSNSLGWRVYVEDWGHVDGSYTAICAIKPVYLWHGK